MKIIKIYINGNLPDEVEEVIETSNGVFKKFSKKFLIIPSKKNSKVPMYNKKKEQMFIKNSFAYDKWKEIMKGFWTEQYIKLYNDKVSLPITRCKINIKFYFHEDRVRDTHNKFETIVDDLVQHKIIADDSLQVISEVIMSGNVCKNNPRTELYISILTPDDKGYEYDVTDYPAYDEEKKQRAKNAYVFKKEKQNTIKQIFKKNDC